MRYTACLRSQAGFTLALIFIILPNQPKFKNQRNSQSDQINYLLLINLFMNQFALLLLIWHSFTDSAKFREFIVCSRSLFYVDTFTNITALLSFSKCFCNTVVNLLLLNEGFCPSFIALITFPNSVNDLFICFDSSNLTPVTFVSFCLSLPAKSTKTKLLSRLIPNSWF